MPASPPPLDNDTGTRSPDRTATPTGPTDWCVRESNSDAEAPFLAFATRRRDGASYRDDSETIAHNERVARRHLAARQAIDRKHPRPRPGR